MAERRRVSVEELQRMSPQERVDLLVEQTVTDLDVVDREFLERANADAARALRLREAADSPQV